MTDMDKAVDIWEVGNEVNGEWADEGCKLKGSKECKSDEKIDGKKTGRNWRITSD
jgi:hypothetical protein